MVQRLKVDGFVDNRRTCDCRIYIVFSAFCRLYCIAVDSLYSTFVLILMRMSIVMDVVMMVKSFCVEEAC